MSNKVKIAVDAMGGDKSPKKIINGIEISLKKNTENYFYLFGDKNLLNKEISQTQLVAQHSEIIDTQDVIVDNESPLSAAKKGKGSSMWKSIESLKEKKTDISLSAGNTGAMLVISRLLLNTIDGINKPALAALWPNNNNMSVVLDLGANIECDEKNLSDFASMGSALFKSLFESEKPKIALLNVGLEEIKGNDILKMLLSYKSLKKFREKLDPRKYNGAIFLGLENPVVKSHGSTDAIGFSNSINVCNKIVKANLIEKIKSNL